MLEIITVVNGYLEENCYIIHNGQTCLVVDPGSDPEKIIDAIKSKGLNPLGVLITHSHFDHVGALDDLKKEYPNMIVINNKNKGDQSIGLFKFKVIENPGHTEDSVSYYFDMNNILFSGDFVFKGTIGNYPDGMEDDMVKSLNIFKYMPSNVDVYPGHGPSTTVKEEIENNPFLRGI